MKHEVQVHHCRIAMHTGIYDCTVNDMITLLTQSQWKHCNTAPQGSSFQFLVLQIGRCLLLVCLLGGRIQTVTVVPRGDGGGGDRGERRGAAAVEFLLVQSSTLPRLSCGGLSVSSGKHSLHQECCIIQYSESDSSKDLCVHVSPNDCSDSCVGSWNRNSVSTWSCSAVVGNLPVYTRCTYVREF